MITVGIKELKARLSSYINKVRQGEEVVITDRGKEVAMVVGISRERQAIKSLLKAGKARWSGGKPGGAKGVRIKGKPLSKTVTEERR